MSSQKKLKREIGVFGLTTHMVNSIIGSGIFVLPAIIAAGLGPSSIIAYLFCGFLTLLIMFCYAEISSNITETGGPYLYIERTFGEYAGFITAFLVLLASLAGDAAISNAIYDIISSSFPFFQNQIIRIISLLILFSGLGYVNVIGIKYGINFVKLITIMKIIPLLLIIFFGVMDISLNNLYISSIPSIKDIGSMSIILFFAFQGISTSISVGGEVINAKKTIPKSIFLTIFIVLIIYILIQTISQGILGDSLPEFEQSPLSHVAKHIMGPIGFIILSIGAAISMFGSLSGGVLSAPRVLYSASKDNTIPIKSLSLIHNKYVTPYFSIITYVIISFILASFGGFKQLAIISTCSCIMIYLAISLSIIKLRNQKRLLQKGAFRIPGGYVIPVLSCFICLWFLSNVSKIEYLSISLYLIIITLLYIFIRIKNQKNRQKPIDNISK